MINIYVSPFGHMREFMAESSEIQLKTGRITELRQVLSQKYEAAAALIDICVFSDDTRILDENEILQNQANISILPPVCGG